jgi:transcriptional regulator with XRE-family HTH domain
VGRHPRQALIQARQAKYPSTFAFARAMRVNRVTAWRWEQGQLDPSRAKAEEAARLLGRSVEELFGDAPTGA